MLAVIKLTYRLGVLVTCWQLDIPLPMKCALIVGVPTMLDWMHYTYVKPYHILYNLNTQQGELRQLMSELMFTNEQRFSQMFRHQTYLTDTVEQQFVVYNKVIKETIPAIEETKVEVSVMAKIFERFSESEEGIGLFTKLLKIAYS